MSSGHIRFRKTAVTLAAGVLSAAVFGGCAGSGARNEDTGKHSGANKNNENAVSSVAEDTDAAAAEEDPEQRLRAKILQGRQHSLQTMRISLI